MFTLVEGEAEEFLTKMAPDRVEVAVEFVNEIDDAERLLVTSPTEDEDADDGG